MIAKRNIRIGNVSGAVGDHPHAMQRMAANGSVDIITGDWLSEMNIAWNAITKQENPDLGYEAGFLDQLEESLDVIVRNGIKVVSNAGALNPQALAAKTQELCRKHGYSDVMVATVVGDDISELVRNRERLHELDLAHLDHDNWKLSAWEQQPVCGNAYIGSWGINKALSAGAQIVICGRVTDASPVIGAASWWHGWTEHDYDQLAGALVAGHLIECGPYVCGANFSGFKSLMPLVDLAFPIAEIGGNGSCAISKLGGLGGAVTKFTVTAQLLYELQGELYLNSDVVANLSGIQIEESGTNCVHVFGVRGLPPPPTTKAMIAAPGGYQAETTFYINGLDVAAKAQMMKDQIKHAFQGSKFSKFSVELYGSQASNPGSQQEGTVVLRVFAQANKLEDISKHKFLTPIYALRMQSYPGYHMSLDFRTMQPKPFMKIFPVTISQASLSHAVHLPNPHGTILIPPPSRTAHYPAQRASYETAEPVDMASFGPSRTAPLGSIVHARSGDKADNSNVGFFVRNADEYPWLQSLLTVAKLKQLLGKDWEGREGVSRMERCEFPKLFAVHFRILDFLDGGIASSARIDGLGKGIGEYLRSREVDIPINFLDRGCI